MGRLLRIKVSTHTVHWRNALTLPGLWVAGLVSPEQIERDGSAYNHARGHS